MAYLSQVFDVYTQPILVVILDSLYTIHVYVHVHQEHVVIDYKYVDLEGSGIFTVEGEPTNAKFYTERPVLWKNALLQYHMGLYQQNIHSQMPTFRPSENGDQLLVRGNYPHGSSEYLVTVFVYTSGVVLIQGRDFMD